MSKKPSMLSSPEHKSLAIDLKNKSSLPSHLQTEDDLYDVSPSSSPISPLQQPLPEEEGEELPMSEEEAHRILWPDHEPELPQTPSKPQTNGKAPGGSEKFLLADGVNIEDKARMFEDDKILRDEKDHALRMGAFKGSSA